MSDAEGHCRVTLPAEGGRHCKRLCVAGTNYCWQHQRDRAPAEEDRLAVLGTLGAPGVTTMELFDVRDRILGRPAGDGRTSKHRQWLVRSFAIIGAAIELDARGLIYEAVPADGVHPGELKISDAGREVLALEQTLRADPLLR
jgi:hypothetical protein